MYEVGCIANILQMLKLPDGTVKVLVEGLQRAKALSIEEQETQFSCEVMLASIMPTALKRKRCARSCRSSTST